VAGYLLRRSGLGCSRLASKTACGELKIIRPRGREGSIPSFGTS